MKSNHVRLGRLNVINVKPTGQGLVLENFGLTRVLKINYIIFIMKLIHKINLVILKNVLHNFDPDENKNYSGQENKKIKITFYRPSDLHNRVSITSQHQSYITYSI